MNAREAMHLIELRSGREGHPSYRAVAHELHAQIAEAHPAVGGGDDASWTRTPSRGWSAS
ncbi:MAG: FAD-dependent thymidylate synthase [Thermoleophilaceae bacterium]